MLYDFLISSHSSDARVSSEIVARRAWYVVRTGRKDCIRRSGQSSHCLS